MNSVYTTAESDSRASAKAAAVGAGWVSILQGLLIFVPMVVLGAAINWPESLSDPADIALPRLLENEGAVRFGYVAYLIYSILFAVTIALLVRYVKGAALGVLAAVIIGFAMISALARSIGIVRWLVAAAAVLSTTVELFGSDASSLIFFGTTLVQLWFLAVGIWLLVRGRTRIAS
ncbi:MAG: DUF4386 family protein [Actinobacteria bacterium]|nr:DUF4386 family protein [Actinomycetota bacterium]